jgi:hypothetical protein
MSTADRERQQVTMRSMKRLSTKQREAAADMVAVPFDRLTSWRFTTSMNG